VEFEVVKATYEVEEKLSTTSILLFVAHVNTEIGNLGQWVSQGIARLVGSQVGNLVTTLRRGTNRDKIDELGVL